MLSIHLKGKFAIQSTSKPSSAQGQSDQEYIVTLSDGNKWPFPRITWCPHRGCPASFMFRRDALDHYNKQHAATAVLCTLCQPQKPITISVIPLHYATVHPGAQVPPDWKEQVKWILYNLMILQKLNKILKKFNLEQIKKECEVCQKMLSSQKSLSQHKASQHQIGKYKCPHNECDHTESNRFKIDTHWEKRHAHTSVNELCDSGKFQPFKSYKNIRVWVITDQSTKIHFRFESNNIFLFFYFSTAVKHYET